MIGAAVLLWGATARAEVVIDPEVPFTEEQLAAAMAARGRDGRGLLLEISRPIPGVLLLVLAARRWEIPLGPERGETAARVVALYVIELSEPPLEISGAERAAAPPPGGARYRVAALGVGALGIRAGDFTSVGGAFEVTRVGRWVTSAGLSWQRGLTIDRDPGAPIRAELFRLRGMAGVALGQAELVAGGFAGRMIVDGGTGVIDGWALGAAAELRATAPVAAGWSIAFSAGVEVFRHRVEVRLEEDRLGATPRVALAGGVGLAWIGGAR